MVVKLTKEQIDYLETFDGKSRIQLSIILVGGDLTIILKTVMEKFMTMMIDRLNKVREKKC